MVAGRVGRKKYMNFIAAPSCGLIAKTLGETSDEHPLVVSFSFN
jgi:hypothetical protein